MDIVSNGAVGVEFIYNFQKIKQETECKVTTRQLATCVPLDILFFFFLQTSASMGIDQCRLSAVVEIVAESYFLMFCFQLKRSNSCPEMSSTTN